MKSKSIRVAIALAVLLAVVQLILSCGTNQNGNVAVKYHEACDATNIDSKVAAVQGEIDAEIADDKQLKDGRVKVLVRKVGDRYLEVLVEGYAGGEDELNDLTHILRKFMNKEKKCVLTVTFVSTGTIPASSNTALGELFKWSACEWPLVACPGGECMKACSHLTPMSGTSNSETNSSPNANSNSEKSNN